MGIGFLGSSFLLEMPSSYFADRFWHKKTLVLSKIFQFLSVVFYIVWAFVGTQYVFLLFSIWALLQSVGFALFSGTTSAFLHEILEERGEEKKFSEVFWKLMWNVSLASIPIIILLSLSVEIDMLFPFWISLVIDILWFLAFDLYT